MNKTKATLLLFLIAIPLLTFTRTVQSQQYTTLTLTNLVTNTQASTVTAGTQTQTTTQPQLRSIFSAPVTIPGTHGVCGIYFQQAFNATAGDILTGTLTSNSKVDLYVLTDAAFQAWSHQVVAGGNCTPSNPVLIRHDTTSYNYTATIQSSGVYQIIMNNLSHSTVVAQLSATIATMGPGMITMTMYSTIMQETVQTVMQTSTQTVESSSGAPSVATPLLIGVVVILIIAALVYVVVVKRRPLSAK